LSICQQAIGFLVRGALFGRGELLRGVFFMSAQAKRDRHANIGRTRANIGRRETQPHRLPLKLFSRSDWSPPIINTSSSTKLE
jgi:hypothetical protein